MTQAISQVGAIPYRKGKRGLKVLLITSQRLGWSIPKGHIDPGVPRRRMAEIEAEEEAGAVGKARGAALGHFVYRRRGIVRVKVRVYSLSVAHMLDSWDEEHRRDRRWLPADEAASRVGHQPIARLIRRLIARHAK